MASFTEQATLRVVDKSSAQIRKINAELKKLFATARTLKSASVSIKVNAAGVTAANRQLLMLSRTMATLRRQSVSLNVNMRGITAATAALTRLQQQAARPVRVNVQHTGGAGGTPGGQPRNAPPRRTPGARQAGAVAGGVAAGIGISNFSRLNGEFGVLAASAYAAARALREVGEAGYARSRTEAQTQAMASKAQQEVYKNLPPGHKGAVIPFRQDTFERMRNEIAGDVAGDTPEETARNADAMVRRIQNEIYPGLVLRNPSLTPEQTIEGVKKIIRAGGMATSEIFDKGEITADWKRFEAGIQEGLRVNPDIPFEKIRTTVAGLRTAGFQMDPDAIARAIVMAGDKGARVGNEQFQFQQTMRGIFKNKALNKALTDRGTLLPGGGVRNEALLGSNPLAWAYEEFNKDIEKHLAKKDTKARIQKAVTGGKTVEEATQNERVNALGRILPSLKQTALSTLAAAVLEEQQWRKQRGQSQIAADPEEARRIAEKSPAIQWENLKTAVDTAAGNLGKLGLDAASASGVITGFTKLLRSEPLTTEEKTAVGVAGVGAGAGAMLLFRILRGGLGGPAGAIAGGVAGAAAGAAGLPANAALNISAGLLNGAAGALTSAAAALAGAGVVGGAAAGAARGGALARIFPWLAVGAAGVLAAPHLSGSPAPPEYDKGPEAVANKMKYDAARYELIVAQRQLAAMRVGEPVGGAARLGGTRRTTDADVDSLRTKIADLELRLIQLPGAPRPTVSGVPAGWQPSSAVKPWPGAGGAEPHPATEGMDKLVAASTTFSTVFATGATAIGNSGQVAGSTLMSMAPGIGSSIGSTAGAAIAAAVANLSVKVNVNQSPAASTGPQKPD